MNKWVLVAGIVATSFFCCVNGDWFLLAVTLIIGGALLRDAIQELL